MDCTAIVECVRCLVEVCYWVASLCVNTSIGGDMDAFKMYGPVPKPQAVKLCRNVEEDTVVHPTTSAKPSSSTLSSPSEGFKWSLTQSLLTIPITITCALVLRLLVWYLNKKDYDWWKSVKDCWKKHVVQRLSSLWSFLRRVECKPTCCIRFRLKPENGYQPDNGYQPENEYQQQNDHSSVLPEPTPNHERATTSRLANLRGTLPSPPPIPNQNPSRTYMSSVLSSFHPTNPFAMFSTQPTDNVETEEVFFDAEQGIAPPRRSARLQNVPRVDYFAQSKPKGKLNVLPN